MKENFKKIIDVLRLVFGYGIIICLFGGGLTFFGYLAALIIGGDVATEICTFIYKTIFPILIKTSTILVLFGMVIMYLNGEKVLTANKKQASKHKGEM